MKPWVKKIYRFALYKGGKYAILNIVYDPGRKEIVHNSHIEYEKDIPLQQYIDNK